MGSTPAPPPKNDDLFPGALPKEIGASDLANLLGVTTQRIHQLRAEGLPAAGHGRYLLNESVQWIIKYWKTKNQGTSKQLDTHRKRLLNAQAKKAEIDNELRLKELIPAELIASTLNQVGVIIASQLAGLAPRLSNELTNQDDPAYIKKVIDDETRQIRISVANLFDELAVTKNHSGNSKTAPD